MFPKDGQSELFETIATTQREGFALHVEENAGPQVLGQIGHRVKFGPRTRATMGNRPDPRDDSERAYRGET